MNSLLNPVNCNPFEATPSIEAMLTNLSLNVPVFDPSCIPQDLNGSCIIGRVKPFVKVHLNEQKRIEADKGSFYPSYNPSYVRLSPYEIRTSNLIE